MSHQLFDQTLIPPTRRRGARALVTASVLLHAIGLTAMATLPLAAGVDPPSVHRPLVAMIATTELPRVPEVRPVPPTATPSPAAAPSSAPAAGAPTVAPTGFSDEPALAVAPPGRPGLAVGFDQSQFLMSSGSGTTLRPPPPPPAPQKPIQVGGQIAAPTRVFYRPPTYPDIARTARVEGMVILEATIDERGEVTGVKVLRSVALLDRAAIEAVSACATRRRG